MDRRGTFVLTVTALIGVAAVASAQTPGSDVKFTYSYPRQVRAIPALKAWIDREAANLRAGVRGQAAADRRQAAQEGRPFHPYETVRTWKVVTDTPRFLSLSLQLYDYTGGAHGSTGYRGLVWDRARQTRMAPLAFFSSARALRAAIRRPFCDKLNRQRETKRGAPITARSVGPFDGCIDPAAQAVLIGSTDQRRFDRIGILVAPYEAGSYAEGTYDVTLPVTPAVLAAVRPEWRRYFASRTRSRGAP